MVFDKADEVVLLRLVKIGGLGIRAAAADDIWWYWGWWAWGYIGTSGDEGGVSTFCPGGPWWDDWCCGYWW